ncbi:MAG: helix-turn-helix transcriptional regulator [Ruminococcaceae bacterium]|nr:helix-turn-helix transcriptional regulator [Oscillospiraceae bacterium]
MISYSPLWKTMEEKGITTYTLINQYGINPRTIHNLKHNKSITLYTVERLCKILDCQAESVVVFIEE